MTTVEIIAIIKAAKELGVLATIRAIFKRIFENK